MSDWSSDVCSSDLPLVVAAMTAAFWTGTAAAHADHGIPPEEAWSAWVFDPIIIVPLMLALWLYALGRRRLSPTRRRPAEALAFTIGAAMLVLRSEEHTPELQSLTRNPNAVFCL